ncbi:MAG: hypothetical protein LBS22_00105 [Puniceicoccales bacterium]|jgi:hypothetical protein|nr:hypothetical protein [Puniceicoccales bacterium]
MNMNINGLTPKRQQELLDRYSRLSREQNGQRILQDAGVAYPDPTFDRTFKWLMGPDNSDIERTVFDSMVFLTYRGLVTRRVHTVGYISQMTINILKVKGAVGMDVSQRRNERRRVKDAFKASLRQRYPELIKEGESFKDLWVSQSNDDVKLRLKSATLGQPTKFYVFCGWHP